MPCGISLFLSHIDKCGTYYISLDHKLTTASFDTEIGTCFRSALDKENIDGLSLLIP